MERQVVLVTLSQNSTPGKIRRISDSGRLGVFGLSVPDVVPHQDLGIERIRLLVRDWVENLTGVIATSGRRSFKTIEKQVEARETNQMNNAHHASIWQWVENQ
jgi:uncharacterized membrane protein